MAGGTAGERQWCARNGTLCGGRQCCHSRWVDGGWYQSGWEIGAAMSMLHRAAAAASPPTARAIVASIAAPASCRLQTPVAWTLASVAAEMSWKRILRSPKSTVEPARAPRSTSGASATVGLLPPAVASSAVPVFPVATGSEAIARASARAALTVLTIWESRSTCAGVGLVSALWKSVSSHNNRVHAFFCGKVIATTPTKEVRFHHALQHSVHAIQMGSGRQQPLSKGHGSRMPQAPRPRRQRRRLFDGQPSVA